MYCSKCGKENQNNSIYCSNCGQQFNEIVNQNQGGIRKYLKSLAQKQNKTPQIFLTLIYFILIISLFYIYCHINNNVELLNIQKYLILYIPIILLSSLWYILIINTSLKISQNKQINFKDVFKINSIVKLISVYLIEFSFHFVIFFTENEILNKSDELIFLITLLLFIIYCYFFPIIDMIIYSSLDENNKTKSFIQIVKESNKLIKNHRKEYYAIYISFIGWFFLSPLTLGIILLWIEPYIILTISNYYNYLKGNIKIEIKEKGLNSSSIIRIFFASVSTLIVLLAIIGSIPEPQNIENEITNKEEIIKYNNKEITFIVPKGFNIKRTQNNANCYYNANNDYIYYFKSHYKPNEYEQMKESYIKSAKQIYDDVEYINEYEINIYNQNIKVFKIVLVNNNIMMEETVVFFQVDENNALEIGIGVNDINQNNIKNYIKLKDNSINM